MQAQKNRETSPREKKEEDPPSFLCPFKLGPERRRKDKGSSEGDKAIANTKGPLGKWERIRGGGDQHQLDLNS